jgi:hypothetical protein
MLGTIRRAVQVKKLETRKKKLEEQRDLIIASMVNDNGSHLYRHEYPNTPVLEDLFLELEYLEEALAERSTILAMTE